MTHVYCTHCKWFWLDKSMIPRCKYESVCNLWNPEDSTLPSERPYYEEREINK